MSNTYPIRTACVQDIPTLASHRRWMFEDIRRLEGKVLDPQMTIRLEESYREYAAARLGSSLFAWIIEDSGKPIASASLSLLEGFAPHPNNLSGINPLLHGVYTLPEYRRKGLARRLVETIIAFARQRELPFIKLNASKEGRSVYAALGFTESSEMRLRLK